MNDLVVDEDDAALLPVDGQAHLLLHHILYNRKWAPSGHVAFMLSDHVVTHAIWPRGIHAIRTSSTHAIWQRGIHSIRPRGHVAFMP